MEWLAFSLRSWHWEVKNVKKIPEYKRILNHHLCAFRIKASKVTQREAIILFFISKCQNPNMFDAVFLHTRTFCYRGLWYCRKHSVHFNKYKRWSAKNSHEKSKWFMRQERWPDWSGRASCLEARLGLYPPIRHALDGEFSQCPLSLARHKCTSDGVLCNTRVQIVRDLEPPIREN